MLDVVFDLAGRCAPADYAYALRNEVARVLPWMEDEPLAGIHPLRGARTDYGLLLLPRRAKLVLRVPAPRTADALALAGKTLTIGAHTLTVGPGRARELRPYGAMYAHYVVAESDDEERFLAAVDAAVSSLGIACKPVCGKRDAICAGARALTTFSLMLHEMDPDDSLVLQRVGLGAERLLGCGVFVPHRLAAAVGMRT